MATEIGDAIPRFRALSRLHVQDSGLRLQSSPMNEVHRLKSKRPLRAWVLIVLGGFTP